MECAPPSTIRPQFDMRDVLWYCLFNVIDQSKPRRQFCDSACSRQVRGGSLKTSPSELPDRLTHTVHQIQHSKWVSDASDCEYVDLRVVGSRLPRMSSPAVQGSIQPQYQHTITISRVARPDLEPPSEEPFRKHAHPNLEPWSRCFSTTPRFCSRCICVAGQRRLLLAHSMKTGR